MTGIGNRGSFQPIGLGFITIREFFYCNLQETRACESSENLVKSSEGNTKSQAISSSGG